MSTKGIFRCIAALSGILLLAVPAAAQLENMEAEQEPSTDKRLASLIERLEIGMSALEELERRDALEIVKRIVNELREEQERGRQRPAQDENDEVKTVRRRLKVMRTAVDAFLEANRRDAAELVEHAMHARELALDGRRDEEANRIRETAPNRGQLAETLGAAAKLYRKWNMPERAETLAELAETCAKQWKRQQHAERERESGEGLDSLATRVEIIRYARAAFAEAGDERNSKVLEGVVHYGELALEGANDEQLSKAAEAVPSKANLIEYMNWASRKYGEWGRGERAAACRKLAEYYTRQLRAEHREGGEEREAESERDAEGNIEDLNHRIEILRFALDAFTRAGHEESAHTMRRFLHVAELQREGADDRALAQAFEGLSMERTIELLQKASGIYAEWGVEERAETCNQLAEFYAAREHGRTTEDR